MADTNPGTGNTEGNKTNKKPCPQWMDAKYLMSDGNKCYKEDSRDGEESTRGGRR